MAPLKRRLPLIITILSFFLQAQGVDKYTDENRPYEFGFTIDGEQHRHEKKDERGLIMGEFGFITADGVYHVTVYATDENGNFKILSMKNIRMKPFPTVSERNGNSLPFPPANQQALIPPVTQPSYKPITDEQPSRACSSCSLPTKKPPQLPPASISFGGQPDQSQGPINYPQGGFDAGAPNINQRFGQPDEESPNYSQEGVEQQYTPQNQGSPNYQQGAQGQENYPQYLGSLDNQQGQRSPNYSPGQGPPDFQQGQNNPNFPQDQGSSDYQQGQGNPNYSQDPQSPNYSQDSGSPNYSQGFGQQGEQYYPELNSGQPDYAQPGAPNFESPGFAQDAGNLPQSSAGSQRNSNDRNPKQYYPEEYNSNDVGGGQAPQKPQLISAQMQIVDSNTDIYAKKPGERDGLPDGLTRGDMNQLLYTFNYTVGFHGHHEEGYVNGAKTGYYFVTGRDGSRIRVDYVADENGFRPKISTEVLDLLSDEVPKPETEKDQKYGLKGYEFKWLYFPVESREQY